MSLWTRLKDLGPRSRAHKERDLEREIQSHLDLEAEESGHYGARRAFGNTMLVKEDVRAAWGWTRVEQLARDVGYGLRQVRRNPGVLGHRHRHAGARHRRQHRDVQRRRCRADSSAALCRRRPSRHDLGRRHGRHRRPEVLLDAARVAGVAAAQHGVHGYRGQPARQTRRSRTTASPRSCRPAKSPATSGPCSARSRCSDASSPKTKTRAARGSSSSATDCGSGASARRPTCVGRTITLNDSAVRSDRRDAARVLLHARARYRHLDADLLLRGDAAELGVARRALRRAAQARRHARAGPGGDGGIEPARHGATSAAAAFGRGDAACGRSWRARPTRR